jgi:oligoribonuclease NrnB/cAMP/cGMP phosphodiesterase (DHH superfamily)
MDVIPKFIANENMKELNNELMDRLLKKKNIFTKMMKSYFSDNEDSFTNSLQEIQKEMDGYKDIMEKCKDRDFDGFMDLLSFINSNKTNMNLSSMQSMTLDDYRNMNYDTKKIF